MGVRTQLCKYAKQDGGKELNKKQTNKQENKQKYRNNQRK